MRFDKPLDDAEAKACTIGGAPIFAPEPFKDMRQVFVGNAVTIVSHRYLRSGAGRHINRGIARRMLERVIDKVAVNAKDRLGMTDRLRIPGSGEP